MTKATDKVKIDPIPAYKEQYQPIGEYLIEIQRYCLTFHNQVKDVYFKTEEEARNFWGYMIHNSSEPQYRILRQIAFTESVLKEEGMHLNDANEETVAQIFSILEDLKSYRKNLTSMTYQGIGLKAIVEVYWSGGLSVKEIVSQLIEIKVLAEYDDDNNPEYEKHQDNIRKHVESLKDFDVKRADSGFEIWKDSKLS